jgi:tellurite resistance protein
MLAKTEGRDPMDTEARINLLARIAQHGALPTPVAAEKSTSILALAAASYGLRPSGDATIPTGFDPVAMALFESIVEGAYLVATADAVFDPSERRAFERVVVAACGSAVAEDQISALVSDLGDQLATDGLDRRIDAVARGVSKKEHAHEVLRVAAVLAQASQDVSPPEREVLSRIARACKMEPREVDAALDEVRRALGGTR